MKEKKKISVLGATGSVGRQALMVSEARGYDVDFLTANRDSDTLEALARKFKPRAVALADPEAARKLRLSLRDTETRVYSGAEGIIEGIKESDCSTVVNSILGCAGLLPSLAAIESGKRLALANKESLVVAGDVVMSEAKKRGVEIIPVDSEHSAIFQALHAGKREEIRRIILTASGGPFFGYTREELERVTLADTLRHPTWKMGKKITVDSATLMNKGFEVIEAAHLFGVPADKIEVTVHRESILHSAVEYIDNSIVGELSVPDMRACVQYAVDYPDRMKGDLTPLDLFSVGTLSFMRPDREVFPFLDLAEEAATLGGGMGAVLNAADEIAVDAFLKEKISFTGIFDLVTATFESLKEKKSAQTLDEILAADKEAREKALSSIFSAKAR